MVYDIIAAASHPPPNRLTFKEYNHARSQARKRKSLCSNGCAITSAKGSLTISCSWNNSVNRFILWSRNVGWNHFMVEYLIVLWSSVGRKLSILCKS